MKKILFSSLFLLMIIAGNAQAAWTPNVNLDSLLCSGGTGGTFDNTCLYAIGENKLFFIDPITHVVTRKADCPGMIRSGAISWVEGKDIYYGTGTPLTYAPTYLRDVWVYHSLTDQWDATPLTFPGVSLMGASTFTIGSKVYVVGGLDSAGYGNCILWIHDKNILGWNWTQGAVFPGIGRYIATAYAVGGDGYFGTGFGGAPYGYGLTDCWRYSPSTDSWMPLANPFPGAPRGNAVSFEWEGNWVVGLGNYCTIFGDLYSLNPATGMWSPFDSIPSVPRAGSIAAALNGKVYVLTGMISIVPNVCTAETWEYGTSVTTDVFNQQDFPVDVTVFPNPATDHVTIMLPNEGGYEITLFDSSGKMVRKVTGIGQVTIDRDDLASGVYLCNITRVDIEQRPTVVKKLIFQ